ncbi:hypothetical protein [Herbidospora sp. NBRC 101105]|uniref:hypothetical protein n=1 Tax=Herbidospora sp. NBRC 101105 TaxID=3032195 RepID=UPI002552A5BC|nr:hypothetical protein [Herbidospora sp. NBRC 101105]
MERSTGTYLKGVVAGDDEVYLGRIARQVGDHWVGFDDSFAMPVMRAFCRAPEKLRPEPYFHLGYMQFAQVNVYGVAVPPSVFVPHWKEREAYVWDEHTQQYLDFMGPAEARARDVSAPFYAFNGQQRKERLREEAYYYHGRPNGSLLQINPFVPETGTGLSRCASIVCEVDLELLSGADVAELVKGWEPLVVIDRKTGEEPYRTALTHLRANPLPDAEPEDTDPVIDEIVGDSDIVARVIGEYVLLEMPDPEHLGSTLCVSATTTKITVHALSAYDVKSARDRAVAEMWDRLYDHLASVNSLPAGRVDKTGDLPCLRPRPGDFAVELRYTTVLAGLARRTVTRSTGGGRREALSAFTWSALAQFDEVSGDFGLTAIRLPAEVGFSMDPVSKMWLDVKTMSRYDGLSIDLSHFTRAAIARDGFASRGGLREVRPLDTVMSTGSGT